VQLDTHILKDRPEDGPAVGGVYNCITHLLKDQHEDGPAVWPKHVAEL